MLFSDRHETWKTDLSLSALLEGFDSMLLCAVAFDLRQKQGAGINQARRMEMVLERNSVRQAEK